MRQPIFVYGAGGLGREVVAMMRHLEMWEPMGFIDDGKNKGTMIQGLPVRGGGEMLSSLQGMNVVIAVGDPLVKRSIASRFSPAITSPYLVHPSVQVLDSASVIIGAGAIITAGVSLTTDIRIGAHVLLNLNCTVGHDCTIGSFSSIMPGVNIAGEVKLAECVMLGSGSNILNRVTIGEAARVGMGAVVLTDVKENTTVVGVPAKPIIRRDR
jgi:sugar O-acyltransferase (sialic acid O-acetyltransferase NeuD family)